MGDCRRTIRGMFKGMDGFFAWFGLVLRQARRDADMSQRELARWSAVPKSVIADAESGRATNLYVATQLLNAMGYEVAIRNCAGDDVEELLADERRDRDGRRFPPHLDVRQLSDEELTRRHRDEYRPNPLTAFTYRLNRRARDAERYHGWYGEGPHNWAPPHPDRDYVRMVLGREPVFEWFWPRPLDLAGRGPFDQRAVEMAGLRAPALRRARAGERPARTGRVAGVTGRGVPVRGPATR